MQDRYVGDVGDFVKLSLLRALSPGNQMGVIWYRVKDENHNRDGRHIAYLRGEGWSELDPELFSKLRQIVDEDNRSVLALENAGLFPNCAFYSEYLPLPQAFSERLEARKNWIEKAAESVLGCNFIFLDPDNGLEPTAYSPRKKSAIKSISDEDLKSFNTPKRIILAYHHQTRRTGGHIAEIAYYSDRLREIGFDRVDALRARPYSARVFFLLNGTDEMRERAKRFADTWGDKRVTWHENP